VLIILPELLIMVIVCSIAMMGSRQLVEDRDGWRLVSSSRRRQIYRGQSIGERPLA
jgi:hypothetical protein